MYELNPPGIRWRGFWAGYSVIMAGAFIDNRRPQMKKDTPLISAKNMLPL
jgi:hypothetical protein